MARDEASGHALGKDVLEQLLEDGGRIQLARTTNGRVPGQVLVHLATQTVDNSEPQAAVLDEPPVTKTELLELRDWPVFTDLADAQNSVADYFDYDNHKRWHSSIGYSKPYHFHQQQLANITQFSPA